MEGAGGVRGAEWRHSMCLRQHGFRDGQRRPTVSWLSLAAQGCFAEGTAHCFLLPEFPGSPP
eukprot:796990-Lingulodinium_polyedra.AAC.1